MPREKKPRVIGRSPTPSQKKSFAFTQLGNADRLVEKYGQDICYCKAWGWTVWNGRSWDKNATDLVGSMAVDTIREMREEAEDLVAEAESMLSVASSEKDSVKLEKARALERYAKAYCKWVCESETSAMVHGMINLARANRKLHVDHLIFDTHKNYYNCKNGTINMKNGKLHAHKREDFLTVCVPIRYNPKATCPNYIQLRKDAMLNRQELLDYLHRLEGYCATAETYEQAIIIFTGSGDNGKSTYIEAYAHVLGGYADVLPEKTIVVSFSNDGSAPSPDLADLCGKRFVRVGETERNAQLAVSLLKKLSGEDKIKARYLHKDPFTFDATHKIIIHTNHPPQIRDSGPAIWRRIQRVPFDYKLPKSKKDKQLPTKLREEEEGILAHVVQGAMKWYQEGLNPPGIVIDLTETYKVEQDLLGMYIQDFCTSGDDKCVPTSDFLKAYNAWLRDEMFMKTMSSPALKAAMEERGYLYKRSKSDRIFTGIELRKPQSKASVRLLDSEPSSNGHTSNRHGNASTVDLELSLPEGL
jgi:putative DNA primase/helicase